MRIGILSLVLHTNYGGILQAYALQTVLERMGHDVFILTRNRSINYSVYNQLISYGRTFIKKYLLHRDAEFVNLKKMEIERLEHEQYTKDFIEKYINTRIIGKLNWDSVSDLDAIVVGSDQVWRSGYFRGHWNTGIEDAFLSFLEGKTLKRIAYAASFGTDEWEYNYEETIECRRLIQMFDAVSVREESGILLCKEKLFRDNAKCVLDPTLLLSKDDYLGLIKNSTVEASKGNLMCYVLDMTEDKQNLIEQIAHSRGLTPFTANSRVEDLTAPHNERIQPPLEQWLQGFIDADFIVTDSFHACIFSIIFNKPFVVVGNYNRGLSRFKTLLSLFGLTDHLILSNGDYNDCIEYNIPQEVYDILSVKTKESLGFIRDNL